MQRTTIHCRRIKLRCFGKTSSEARSAGRSGKTRRSFSLTIRALDRTQAPTVNTQMPSVANFGGQLLRLGEFANGCPCNGPAFASQCSPVRLGYTVTDQEPYYTPGCTTMRHCVFPNAVIPQNAWSPVAVNMLKLGLIPQPNAPNNFFETSQYAQTLNDNKGGIRVDQNTRLRQLVCLLLYR